MKRERLCCIKIASINLATGAAFGHFVKDGLLSGGLADSRKSTFQNGCQFQGRIHSEIIRSRLSSTKRLGDGPSRHGLQRLVLFSPKNKRRVNLITEERMLVCWRDGD